MIISNQVFNAQQEKRLALVIGNANYKHYSKLRNPINDAKLISATLKKLNFETIEAFNTGTRNELMDVIRVFGKKRKDYDVAFVYYAGHAIQIDNTNYLMPTDELINTAATWDAIDMQLVSVQSVAKWLENESKDKINVLILDACRNNPIPDGSRAMGISGGGLSKENNTEGTLIAFAAAAGKTASDGHKNSKNSPYAKSLAKHMMSENISIYQVFKNVRADIESMNLIPRQSPEFTDKTTGADFYLNINPDDKFSLDEFELQLEEHMKKEDWSLAFNKSKTIENIYKSQKNSDNLEKLHDLYFKKAKIASALITQMNADTIESNDEEAYLKMDEVLENLESIIDSLSTRKDDFPSTYSKALFNIINLRIVHKYYGMDLYSIEELNRHNKKHFGGQSYELALSKFLAAFAINKQNPPMYMKLTRDANLRLDKAIEKNRTLPSEDYIIGGQSLDDYQIYIRSHFIRAMSLFIDYANQNGKLKIGIQNELGWNINKWETKMRAHIEKYINYASTLDSSFFFKRALTDSKNFYSENIIDVMGMDQEIGLQFEIESTKLHNKIRSICKLNSRELFDLEYDDFKKTLRVIEAKKKSLLNITSMDLRKMEGHLITLPKYATNSRDSVKCYNDYTSIYKLINERYFSKQDMDSNLFCVQNLYYNFDKIQAPIKKIINEEFYAENVFLEDYTELYESYYKYSAELLQNDTTGRLNNLHQNNLKYVMRHPKLGYGHPDMIYAYNSLAETEDKIEDKIETYFQNLEYIEDFSSEWRENKINNVDTLIEYQKIMCYTNLLSTLFWHNEYLYRDDSDDFLSFDTFTMKYVDVSFLSKLSLFINNAKGWKPLILDLERYFLYAKNGFLITDISSDFYTEAFDNATIGIKKCKEYKESKPVDEFDYINSTFAQYFTETQNRMLMKLESDSNELEKKLRRILKTLNEFQCSSLMIHDEIFKNIKSLQPSEKEAQEICFEAAEMHERSLRDNLDWYGFDMAQYWMDNATQYKFTSKKDRYKNIELSKRYFRYTNINDSTWFQNLISCYETIANEFYWLKEYDSSVYYSKKAISILNNPDFNKDKDQYLPFKWEDMIWTIHHNLNDSIYARNETEQWMNYLFGSKMNDIENYNCTIVNRKFGTYDIPFFQFNFESSDGFWPVIEFDLDGNNKVDDGIDRRYFFDFKSNQFKTENISTMHHDFGGFKFPLQNYDGTAIQDTSSEVYFDKNNSFSSNIRFNFKPIKPNQILEGIWNNNKINEWTIQIPLDELNLINQNNIRFILSLYHKDPTYGQHSYHYKRFLFPFDSRIYGFERAFEFDVK